MGLAHQGVGRANPRGRQRPGGQARASSTGYGAWRPPRVRFHHATSDKWRDVDRNERVQYFTAPNGTVHPIRASYEHKSSEPDAARKYREAHGDEAF